MLIRIPALLGPEALAQARALLAQAPWEHGAATAGTQARQVKHNEQLAPSGAHARQIQSLVLDALQGHPLFFSAALPRRIFPPMVNRYSGATNHYGAHVDNAVRVVPGSDGERVRADVSATVFLAEPHEYDGGELVIDDTYGEQRVKLAAGDMVLYPGTSVHRVEPVTRGARLAAFLWVQSLVRSDEQRRLLFDLDMALMRLRERHGDDEDTVRLAGTYHNLLRMWAST
ncbi:Fe2+-dependent dioxygenase [Ideonella sp. 4Y11]|uniref:Fe2+-dependent dioxygenase n=1 Tax=Ideonella aquatica TaxID=2824119 RepID=A0A940YSB9_9BURK|nr:Fe2+-dependent dioxygenase [Ideonella aquatica]MBQ0961972.1 Fe2+-dependent dioxygenase [Ideonella aquatica]